MPAARGQDYLDDRSRRPHADATAPRASDQRDDPADLVALDPFGPVLRMMPLAAGNVANGSSCCRLRAMNVTRTHGMRQHG
jgi:hypothetical protein